MFGKVELPFLTASWLLFQHLLFDNKSDKSNNSQQNTRLYNPIFVFTFPKMKFNNNICNDITLSITRIQGQPCYLIGNMLLLLDDTPKFAQPYIYDT